MSVDKLDRYVNSTYFFRAINALQMKKTEVSK